MAFLFFILQALSLAGFDPQLTSCVKCGKTIQADNHFFAPSDGGVACKECGVHDQYARAITMETLKYLRHIQRTPFNKLKNLVIPPGLAVGLELHTFSLLETLFEGRLKAVDFLRKVRGY